MGASVVEGALCVSHSDLAKDKNRYVYGHENEMYNVRVNLKEVERL